MKQFLSDSMKRIFQTTSTKSMSFLMRTSQMLPIKVVDGTRFTAQYELHEKLKQDCTHDDDIARKMVSIEVYLTRNHLPINA